MNSQSIPPGWRRDPFHRFEMRYWDGARWTHHVAARGGQYIDPPVPPPPPNAEAHPLPLVRASHPAPPVGPAAPAPLRGSKKVQRQVEQAGVLSGGQTGGGTLFTEPVLVVNQKPKIIEVNAEYAVYNQHGHRLGGVREVHRSVFRNSVSARAPAARKKRLHIVDVHGRVVLDLIRPEKVVRSTIVVRHTNGVEVGRIVQKNLIGKVRFDLTAPGTSLGTIKADNWGTWDFSVEDAGGAEVARITKSSSWLGGQTSTKKDKYVVEISEPTAGALRTLVVASALAIDTALRQG